MKVKGNHERLTASRRPCCAVAWLSPCVKAQKPKIYSYKSRELIVMMSIIRTCVCVTMSLRKDDDKLVMRSRSQFPFLSCCFMWAPANDMDMSTHN